MTQSYFGFNDLANNWKAKTDIESIFQGIEYKSVSYHTSDRSLSD
jgi:hypothetical protein